MTNKSRVLKKKQLRYIQTKTVKYLVDGGHADANADVAGYTLLTFALDNNMHLLSSYLAANPKVDVNKADPNGFD